MFIHGAEPEALSLSTFMTMILREHVWPVCMQRLELNERIRELSNEKQSMLERQMALKREVQVLDKQLVKL